MPAKRPDDFKTKSVIETKTSLEKRSVDIEENLLSETTSQIGVVTYPEKHETKKEKKHIPAFQLKPDETMHENIEAIKGLLGTNNKTQIVKQAVAWYRKKLEKELL
jgi:hypothetical protein